MEPDAAVEKNDGTALAWYALHVRSRHELITNSELRRKGINTYLPTIKKWRQWKDRKKFVEFPLFPGYLFVNIDPDSQGYLKVLKTRGSVRFVSSVPGSPVPIPPEEINALMMLVSSGEELDVYPHIREGTRVKVGRGLFAGAEGVLDRKEAHCIFVVNITLLGKSIGVRISADEVECI